MQLFGCFSAGQGSAACELLFVSAVQFSLLFSGHTGLLGLGGYASPPLVSYGQLVLFFGFIWIQPDNEAIGRTKLCFFNSRLTSVIVSLGHAGSTVILAAQLSFVNFVLREEFAFLFQTFSRNDLNAFLFVNFRPSNLGLFGIPLQLFPLSGPTSSGRP